MAFELCWRGMMRTILGTPPHIMHLLLGRTEQVRTYLVFMLWLVGGMLGVVLLGAMLVRGAWMHVVTMSAGVIAWIAYTMTYYRVREIMRAERRAHLEQE